jgi:transcriptional regulator with XRE-family HTH domain
MTRLRELREARNITLLDLSERSGVPLQSCRYAELGGTNPRIGTVVRICAGLQVPISDVVDNLSESVVA